MHQWYCLHLLCLKPEPLVRKSAQLRVQNHMMKRGLFVINDRTTGQVEQDRELCPVPHYAVCWSCLRYPLLGFVSECCRNTNSDCCEVVPTDTKRFSILERVFCDKG